MPTVFAAVTALLYVLATSAHLATLLRDRPRLEKVGFGATAAGLAAHVALLVVIAVTEGGSALVSPVGGVLVGGAALSGAYLVLSRRYELASLGSLVVPLSASSVIAVLAGAAAHASADVSGLVPVHVTLAVLGTAAFALALAFSVLYVVHEAQLKQKRFPPWTRRLPSLDKLDTFTVRTVSVGFIAYTASLLLGLFTQWRTEGLTLEIRSSLSVLTWIIYAIIIQGRITAGWRGRKAAKLIIVGAVCAMAVLVVYLVRG